MNETDEVFDNAIVTAVREFIAKTTNGGLYNSLKTKSKALGIRMLLKAEM